jgi:3-oxoacyl-[acyl-carrier-protein] synthase II
VTGDRDEAAAMHDALGPAAAVLPTVAAKSHFGNLGAGSGLVECVASILALGRGSLFPLLNHEAADPACGIRPARAGDPAGDVFVSTSVTPQGQSGAVVIRSWRPDA